MRIMQGRGRKQVSHPTWQRRAFLLYMDYKRQYHKQIS